MMKIRNGFVSNSSSSSFSINKGKLSEEQIKLIRSHITACNNKTIDYPCGYTTMWHHGESWQITEDYQTIRGGTSMDNFDMMYFLEKIGVPLSDIDK